MSAAVRVPPGGTLGILGGGQLGRMLALAAARLGIECHIYCPDADSPAFQVVRRVTMRPYEDEVALARFAGDVDCITYEFENIPARTAASLTAAKPVLPDVRALETTADRLAEKTFVRSLGIGTAEFRPVASQSELASAIAALGRPAVLKTRRFGYDGKGQAVIRAGTDLDEALARMGGQPAILEAFVPFEREVSVIAVRDDDGNVRTYDVVENEHHEHILDRSLVPARIGKEVEGRARDDRRRDHRGARLCRRAGRRDVRRPRMAIVLVNEIAPRVHNSGHWTIDACIVSQFENHVRAVCGWPLGTTERHSDAVMSNLIGAEVEAWRGFAEEPNAAHPSLRQGEGTAGPQDGPCHADLSRKA